MFNMTRLTLSTLALLVAATGLIGCRGGTSREPPIHLNPNMDTQDKFKSYRKSTFFQDGRTMRTPPKGTVAVGKLRADTKLHCGKADTNDCASKTDGPFIETLPLPLSMTDVERGRDRYNIFCAPCHDKTGYGNGKVAIRSTDDKGARAIKPTSFHTTRLGKMPVGEIFHTVSYGSKSQAMAGYRSQIRDPKDRWSIVAYVRALQRSQDKNAAFYKKPPPPPPPPPQPVPAMEDGDGNPSGAAVPGQNGQPAKAAETGNAKPATHNGLPVPGTSAGSGKK